MGPWLPPGPVRGVPGGVKGPKNGGGGKGDDFEKRVVSWAAPGPARVLAQAGWVPKGEMPPLGLPRGGAGPFRTNP